MGTRPSREDDQLQPLAEGTPEIARDITGEEHSRPAPLDDPDTQVYVVQPGDTPASISKRFYGDEERYRVILEANRDRLDDQDRLQVGSEIRIPPR